MSQSIDVGVDVSVIVAAWNAEAFIDAAIDSALAQEGVSVEVVVSDDASTDGTAARVAARADADPRVKLVQAPQNGGPSAARNRAIDAASGQWIAVLDADDRFAPERLRGMIAHAEARSADIVLDNVLEIDDRGALLSGAPFLPIKSVEQWDLERWARDNRPLRTRCTGYLKPMFRRAFLETHGIRYREPMRNSEDYAIIAECLVAGARVFFCPEPGYRYTRRAGSISHRYDEAKLNAIVAFSKELRASQSDQAKPSTLAALTAHTDALLDAQTLDGMVDSLRRRSFGRAGLLLAQRPRATMVFLRWIAEALGKRMPSFRN